MQLVLKTAPTTEPISLDELKIHLRIDEDDSDIDTDLESIISSAREHIEEITSRKLITQTWDYYFNAFPNDSSFKLPFGNLQSVTHVKYIDSDANETTMAVDDEYIVETNGTQCGRIVLPYSVSWPSFTAYPSNPINIQYVCGWINASSVPGNIKSAIKLICGDLYANKEGRLLSSSDYRENKTVMNLLSSSKLYDRFL